MSFRCREARGCGEHVLVGVNSATECARLHLNEQLKLVIGESDVIQMLLKLNDGIPLEQYWKMRLGIKGRSSTLHVKKWLAHYNRDQWMESLNSLVKVFPECVKLILFVNLVTFPTTNESPTFKPTMNQFLVFLARVPSTGIPFTDQILKYYDGKGIDELFKIDHHGYTALMYCAFKGAVGCVDALLRLGADPNRRNRANFTALTFAIVSFHDECAKRLFRVTTLYPAALWRSFEHAVTHGYDPPDQERSQKLMNMMEYWWDLKPSTVDVRRAMYVAVHSLNSMERWFRRMQTVDENAVANVWKMLQRIQEKWRLKECAHQVQEFMELLVRESSSPPGVVEIAVQESHLNLKYEASSKRVSFGAFLGAGSYATVFAIDENDCIRLTHRRISPTTLNRERSGCELLMRLRPQHHPGILELKEWGTYVFKGEKGDLCAKTADTSQKKWCERRLPIESGIYSIQLRCNGGDLREHLNTYKPTVLEMVDCTKQLVGALQVLAEAKYLHCDIKPENIGLRNGGTIRNPVLLDFGFASPVRTVVKWGTPSYWSPEQLVNAKEYERIMCDETMDLFVLGKVMLEIFLTSDGKHLDEFFEMNIVELCEEWIPKIADKYQSTGLVPILCSMIRFEPTERPKHTELLERLNAL